MEFESCPFCDGTNLKIESKRVRVGTNGLDVPVHNMTYSVRCNKCHARGPAVGGKVLLYTLGFENPKWAKTQAELYAKAADAWNRRANDV